MRGTVAARHAVSPLFFDSYFYLEKPYVRGMTKNVLGLQEFKTAWIDTKWRPP